MARSTRYRLMGLLVFSGLWGVMLAGNIKAQQTGEARFTYLSIAAVILFGIVTVADTVYSSKFRSGSRSNESPLNNLKHKKLFGVALFLTMSVVVGGYLLFFRFLSSLAISFTAMATLAASVNFIAIPLSVEALSLYVRLAPKEQSPNDN